MIGVDDLFGRQANVARSLCQDLSLSEIANPVVVLMIAEHSNLLPSLHRQSDALAVTSCRKIASENHRGLRPATADRRLLPNCQTGASASRASPANGNSQAPACRAGHELFPSRRAPPACPAPPVSPRQSHTHRIQDSTLGIPARSIQRNST